MPALIAVTGANGWVGAAVCTWLEAQGHAVRRLVRRTDGTNGVVLDLEAPAGDDAWRTALDGVGTIVHCAAHVHRPHETPDEQRRFVRVNADGTARLLDAARAAGVARLVFASSAAVYDWSRVDANGASESAPLAPATVYARSKLAAENHVRATGLDWRIGRLGTVFGTGDRGNFQRLAAALRRRWFVIPGDGAARKSVLPVRLAGEALGRLALDPAAAGLVVNLAAPEEPTLREICAAFSRCCGFPVPTSVPLSVLRAAACVGDWAQGARLPTPLTTAALNTLATSTVLNVSCMRARWPDLPWTGFEASLRESAEYYARA